MRASDFLKEAIGANNLYHMTTTKGLAGMINAGSILPSSPEITHGWGFGAVGDHGEVSLTRDPRYYPFDNSIVQIVINKDALAQRHRIKVHGWEGSEERVSKQIPFTSDYIRKVIFLERPSPRLVKKLKELGIPGESHKWKYPKKAYQQIRNINEFAPEGFEQYTLYIGDEYNTYKVDTFADLDAAIEEVSFLRDADPSTLTSYWQIRDINDRVVWNYDPNEAYDAMRSGSKVQFRKPDNLTESTFREHEDQLRDFIKWCVKKLKIKQALPRIRFQDAKEGPDQHRTGYYDDNDDIMWIYTGNRNLIDIMRTVAHELAHRKQHEDNRVHGDQAYPGSPIEQEADAVAGYLMKLYGKANPEIIE